ncbi:recombinase RecA [Weissella muntiaci]|jgi:recombination protein RecA|uniref:Protein RecA n=1 Tax=Weissella muntiaci TaxID=2508881 RepID=A0A6C2C3J6_9LACO|nr:recombinase RecA [Weissella muntiaci]TYC48113.1 recombinase RecA [Weissella muntiaci]
MASGKNINPNKKIEGRIDDPKERAKALDDALKKIEKSFGKGSVLKMGDSKFTKVESTSTGSLKLDVALGIGGLPKGRIIEIYGPESSGKTTLALHAAAEAQRNGGTVAYIDAENAMDVEYARALGVNVDELLLSQPDTGEQGLAIADALIVSGAIDMVVIDSVAALTPKAEIDGEIGDSTVGLQARMMSQALRKMSGSILKTGTTAIFINQLREKIGIMFGNPETTPGGRALKFYSSVRLDVRRKGAIEPGKADKDDDENIKTIGNLTKIKVVKNKVAAPFKEIEVEILFGKGISKTGEMIDLAVDKDIINKSGSWFAYQGEKIGQGKVNVVKYLEDPERTDMYNEIYDQVRAAYIDASVDGTNMEIDETSVETDDTDEIALDIEE